MIFVVILEVRIYGTKAADIVEGFDRIKSSARIPCAEHNLSP